MIKKLSIALLIGLSFLFLFKTGVANAGDCYTDLSVCNAKFQTNHKSVCCRTGGCSSLCGTLDIWEYCFVECCYSLSDKDCGYGMYGNYFYYCNLEWRFKRTKCSVGDTCISDQEYLRPGICDSTGCTVGGIYKACCSKAQDGTRCKCSGGENTGTCFYDNCYGPGITLTCPISAAPTPTHTVCSGTSCVTVSGSGSNECSLNADCGGGATHKVCSGTSCVTVSGSGSNQCSLNADCGGSGPTPTPGGGSCAIISAYKGACPVGYVNSGGCPLGQRRQARTVTPSGCATTLNGVI